MKDAATLKIRGLKCDADDCEYVDMEIKVEDYAAHVNEACPRCGANLLTEADYAAVQALIAAVAITNYQLGPVADGAITRPVSISFDGTGAIHIKETGGAA